jgi:hypothetical protein
LAKSKSFTAQLLLNLVIGSTIPRGKKDPVRGQKLNSIIATKVLLYLSVGAGIIRETEAWKTARNLQISIVLKNMGIHVSLLSALQPLSTSCNIFVKREKERLSPPDLALSPKSSAL